MLLGLTFGAYGKTIRQIARNLETCGGYFFPLASPERRTVSRGGGAAAGGGGGPTHAEALTKVIVTVRLTTVEIAVNLCLVKSRINARIRRNTNICKVVRQTHIFIEIGFVGHTFTTRALPPRGGGAAAGGGGGPTHADGLTAIRDHGPSQQIITPNINRIFPFPTCGGGAAAGGGGGATHAHGLATIRDHGPSQEIVTPSVHVRAFLHPRATAQRSPVLRLTKRATI
jgi:hypothetical protein